MGPTWKLLVGAAKAILTLKTESLTDNGDRFINISGSRYLKVVLWKQYKFLCEFKREPFWSQEQSHGEAGIWEGFQNWLRCSQVKMPGKPFQEEVFLS